ncbi:conjugative transfer system coupling protein TraD [Vibrio tritonius]|uniref:conjugative transfer system coupling protein TraD n=1 Tax=Vibrio tritonius TaxID=1435069 RepID=UPI00315D9173
MSTLRELDGYLRPKYEWRSIIYCSLFIVINWMYSDWIGIPVMWRCACTVIAIIIMHHRFKTLLFITKYQRALTSMKPFVMEPTDIPWDEKEQYLGEGFEYTDIHAQRKWDAEKKNLKPFYKLSPIFHLFRSIEERARLLSRKRNHDKIRLTIIQRFICTVSLITRKRIWVVLWIKVNNPFPPLPPLGGNTVIHGVGALEEKSLFTSLDERTGHTIIVGQSRVGKTRLMETQIVQDIARRDGVVGVFDPKTDIGLFGRVWTEVKRNNLEADFYCFLLNAPEISVKYNGIASFARVTAAAGRIANQLSSGGGNGNVFKDFAFNFMVMVHGALLEMGDRPNFENTKFYIEHLEDLYNRLGEYLMRRDNPYYEKELADLSKPKFKTNAKGDKVPDKLKIGDMKGRNEKTVIMDKLTTDFYERNPALRHVTFTNLGTVMKQDNQFTSKLTASLIPLLTKLTTGKIKDIISPSYSNLTDKRKTFTWDKIIQRKGVFYCGFSAMQDETVAQATGNQFFADLVAKAGEINVHGVNKGIPDGKSSDIVNIWLHCDEFQSLMGEEFVPLLNRSGSAGIKINAYTQTLSDIEDKLGSAAKAKVVLGNFNNVYMMRVVDEDTANYLIQKIASCDLWGIDPSTSTSDGLAPQSNLSGDGEEEKQPRGFYKTRTQAAVKVEKNEKLITADAILNLPKGQYFAFINGKTLYKIRTPMLVDKNMPIPSAEQLFKEQRILLSQSN